MKIALCQLMVGADQNRNLQKAMDFIKQAAQAGADLAILPEMFVCPYQTELFPLYAQEAGGQVWQALSQAAGENRITLVAGSVPGKAGDKVYNTSYIFGTEGQLLGRHRKVHLFDVDLSGGVKVQESATLAPGQQATVVDAAWGRLGAAICYDLRFPELFRQMALAGASLIAVPAAFNLVTGSAHWELTLRARALDNQLFVAAVSPARDQTAAYIPYGHSLLVDPWGTVVAEAGTEEELLLAEIDWDYLEKVRRELPLLQHRRQDLY
ncbi:MAG: carbon-nitrogen hydrolase family protein [Clostridia bacterium]|nr:carbon-nitrogen hydrolase family protein [Clostridia bacterium]